MAATSTARSSSAKVTAVTAEEEEFNARGLVPARAGSKPFALRKTNKNAQPPPAVTYTEGAATAQETEQGADITATDTPPGAGPRNTTDTGRVVHGTDRRLQHKQGFDYPVKPPTPPGKTASNQPPAESEEDESSSQHYSADFSSYSSISHRSSGDDIDSDALNAAKPDGYHDLPGKSAARRQRPVTATLIPNAESVKTGQRAQSAGANGPSSIPNWYDKSTSSDSDATKEHKRERAEEAKQFAQKREEKQSKNKMTEKDIQERKIKEEFGKKSVVEMRVELGYTKAGSIQRDVYNEHYNRWRENPEKELWVWKNQVYEKKEADERSKEREAYEQKVQTFKNLPVDDMYRELGFYPSATDAQLQEAWEKNTNNTWWKERYRMLLAKRQQMQLQREQQEQAEKEAALKAELEKKKAEKERLEAIQAAEREEQAALARAAQQQKENERLREERERAEAESKKLAEEEAERKAAAEKAAKEEAARKRAEDDAAETARIEAKRDKTIPRANAPISSRGAQQQAGKKKINLSPEQMKIVQEAKTMKLTDLRSKIGEIERLLSGAIKGDRKTQLEEVLRELKILRDNYKALNTEFTLPPTWLSMRYIPTGSDTTDLE